VESFGFELLAFPNQGSFRINSVQITSQFELLMFGSPSCQTNNNLANYYSSRLVLKYYSFQDSSRLELLVSK
jgi:hypothetical protein